MPKRQLFLLGFIILLLAACSRDGNPTMGTITAGEIGSGAELVDLPIPPTSPVTLPPPTATSTAPPPTATATPAPATPVPPPTPTPLPAARLPLAAAALANGDSLLAIEHLEIALSVPLPAEELAAAKLLLGQAYLEAGRYDEATVALTSYLEQNNRVATSDHPQFAYFFLAEAAAGAGDTSAALAAFETYLSANPDMAAYIGPRLAALHDGAGNGAAALAARETAAAAPAHRLQAYGNRSSLAAEYTAQGRYEEAMAQWLALYEVVQSEESRGTALYQAGSLAILAGDDESGLALFSQAVNEHPTSYDSYQALVSLVDAGAAVDEYQRGVVDYYAAAYGPAIDAFDRYIAANTAVVSDTIVLDYRPDAHLYLAWSYEGLGSQVAALSQFQQYAATNPANASRAARAQIETGRLYARARAWEQARAAYERYVVDFPGGADAAAAAWLSARLTELANDPDEATARYIRLASAYPNDERAAEALFRAGLLQLWEANDAGAEDIWGSLADKYPGSNFHAAAQIWAAQSLGAPLSPLPATPASRYYLIRQDDLVGARAAFTAGGTFHPPDTRADRVEADEWLKTHLGLAVDASPSALSPELAADARLARGTKLWRLGLFVDGRQEMEALRLAYDNDLLASYQLAIYFSELGVYRSSILAASNAIFLSGTSGLTAPRYLSQLAYPAYYADLIVPLASAYGYDPLLQFALVRQESLFETFIASPVGAQGLSQVMPATGDDIARQLSWPNYATSDLIRPVVGLNFGAFYLSQQLAAFDGAVHAALSAYNAGPGNAARWYGTAGADLDLFVEVIDFPETRLYIERIYVGYVIYRHLYTN